MSRKSSAPAADETTAETTPLDEHVLAELAALDHAYALAVDLVEQSHSRRLNDYEQALVLLANQHKTLPDIKPARFDAPAETEKP